MGTTLLDEVLEPVAACLTPEAARQIADLRADSATQSRFDSLADKSNEGTLTAEESSEYERLIATYHVITILQAKARALLRGRGQP